MAKARPAPKKPQKKTEPSRKPAKVVAKASKPAKVAKVAKRAPAKAPKVAAKPAKVAKAVPVKAKAAGKPAEAPVAKASAKPGKVTKPEKVSGKVAKPAKVERAPEKPVNKPRATKLPPVGNPLTKRELEQILTAGQGRGVSGEGGLKGRLIVKEGLPHLHVIGRDKRELEFLLVGPDQEVLPAYVDHKVSVSGLIRKTTNYAGTVDVRKYSAKRPDEVPAEAPQENKLRYLSPGEIAQVSSPGMGAGMTGFAGIRGSLEMAGDDFFLVVSNGGTRQQVSFTLRGKVPKALKKNIGQTVLATGVIDKSSGWGGQIETESVELRPSEFKSVSRDALQVVTANEKTSAPLEVKLNHGLSVRLAERVGYTWAIEPMTAKRLGLREANFELSPNGPNTREFFFTPRNPGSFECEFFLAKAFTPANVARTFKLSVNVRP